ncbi:hypothetical protein Dimus_036005, partial [Dionaea muscipula]
MDSGNGANVYTKVMPTQEDGLVLTALSGLLHNYFIELHFYHKNNYGHRMGNGDFYRKLGSLRGVKVLYKLDLAKDDIDEFSVKLHGNHLHVQQIVYEKKPKFCRRCWSVGHLAEVCHAPQGHFKWVPK